MVAHTAAEGIFGYALQGFTRLDDTSTITDWFKHKAVSVNLNVLDDIRMAPPEVGSSPIPSTAYKGGYLVGGDVALYPRIGNDFGWLLLGLFGKDTITADKDIDAAAVVGLTAHKFTWDSTAKTKIPWMAFRKVVPHSTDPTKALGEEYWNSKILSATFNFPNDDLVSMSLSVLGTSFGFVEDPISTGQAWALDGFAALTYDAFNKVPLSSADDGVTHGKIVYGAGATELKVVAGSVTIGNVPLDIRQEKTYGSASLEDITIISRAAAYDLLVKWEDPDLYQAIRTGSTTGTAWTPNPFTTSVKVTTQTPALIGADPLDLPYRMEIGSEKVLLQPAGGIVLAGQNVLMMRLQGQALEPDSGDFVYAKVHNTEAAAYAPA